MYTLNALAALALALSASAIVVPRDTPPKGWATDMLEPYDAYHTRYLALSCNTKHDTQFFDQCCHPLLATESLETARPAQCNPADDNVDDSDPPFCDDDDDDDASSTSSATAIPTSSAAPIPSPATAHSAPVTTHSTSQAKASPKPQAAIQAQPAAAPAPAPASAAANTGGFATYFYQEGNAGACGTVHKDTDMIAAIDGDRYGDLGKRSSLCGKRVKITNTKNQKTVTVTIADACPTCRNSNSIDLSEGAFKVIATLDEGIVPISWVFV
ncbi:unnamed protein product [Cyclocybe aegerita]|uniref:RlpA-like protein double-psi beta-barrel domain-containing protein n=1 Tax=Cyclocybe aegerita TaxID=1973307 RepID=A0A8S0W5U6_CYCAE|nr:unnamed protein product [Cyclocybe aegerita]